LAIIGASFRFFNFQGLHCVSDTHDTPFYNPNTGIQSLILKSWGDKESRGLIQLFHGMFAIGAFAAPLIVQPFIQVSQDETLPNSCNVTNSLPIDDIAAGSFARIRIT